MAIDREETGKRDVVRESTQGSRMNGPEQDLMGYLTHIRLKK